MQRLGVRGAVRPLYGSLGVKGLNTYVYRNTLYTMRTYWKCTNKIFSFVSNMCCRFVKYGLYNEHVYIRESQRN